MWLAHELTHEAKWPAFLAAVQIGPTFLLGPWGGALADRVSKRGLIIRTQFVFLGCALALLAFYLADSLTIWAMLGVMFVHGIVQAIDLPTRLAFVPGLVARTDLSNAVALNSLLFNVARAVGPAIAAVLLASAGPVWCFLLNALSYLAVIIAVACIQIPLKPARVDAPSVGGGFRALARKPGLLTLVLISGIVASGGWPLLALLPLYSATEMKLAEGGYGTLLSCVGIGALGAALTAATLGNDVNRRAILLGGLILVGIALGVISTTPAFVVAAGGCVLFGFGIILFFATGQTVVQLDTADGDRGKVMGVWAMMLSAGVPIGNLVLGPLADYLNDVRAVIAVQAGVIAIAAFFLLLRRAR